MKQRRLLPWVNILFHIHTAYPGCHRLLDPGSAQGKGPEGLIEPPLLGNSVHTFDFIYEPTHSRTRNAHKNVTLSKFPAFTGIFQGPIFHKCSGGACPCWLRQAGGKMDCWGGELLGALQPQPLTATARAAGRIEPLAPRVTMAKKVLNPARLP